MKKFLVRRYNSAASIISLLIEVIRHPTVIRLIVDIIVRKLVEKGRTLKSKVLPAGSKKP